MNAASPNTENSPTAPVANHRPDIKGWVVALVSLLLVATSAGQLLYRFSLPTDGWWVRAGAFGSETSRQYTYLDHLIDAPTSLGRFDQVFAVDGEGIDSFRISLGAQAQAMRSRWDAGLPLDYTVMRGGSVRQVSVLPERWTAVAWLRFSLLNIERVAATLGALLLMAIGVFVFVRRPGHSVARALLLVCSALFAQWISTTLPDGISVALDPLARHFVLFFSYSIFLLLVAPAALLFAMLFPHPKPLVLKHGWVQVVPFAIAWGMWGIAATTGAVAWNWLGMLPFLVLIVVFVAHSVFTASDPVERAQLRVAGWGVLIGVLLSMLAFLPIFGMVTGNVANLLRAGNSVGATVIGLALAVAILRYRLLDIELVLRRSLVYSIVTVLLVVIYFASVIVLQGFFQNLVGEQSSLAVVISTLAIAALFNPLRYRVQQWIDERFYRSRYDAERIAAEFGRMAQDEPDLDRLTEELLNVIRDSVEPTRASLWLMAQVSDQPDPLPPGRIRLELPDSDPLFPLVADSEGVTDLRTLKLESPALHYLREAQVRVVVPLINQGELLGMLALGPRRSDQEYSSDDRHLLTDLAARAAPSIRVAELVRQQQIEARDRERMEAELRVARIIQETLLPKDLPGIAGYALSAYWQPAQAVGGDFYDFIQFDDGKLAIIIGDVTDKGVPAALVMSTTRTVLRSAAERFRTPGAVLKHANEMLCPDIPAKMFVTVFYAVLDPATGVIRYANAGHDLPYMRRAGTGEGVGVQSVADSDAAEEAVVEEMRATGMPLGLLPGMRYEEKEIVILPGDTMLAYSDGLVEAHNPQREMFSFRRLRTLVGKHAGGEAMVPWLVEELVAFAGADWEQEDDVTIVTLQRNPLPPPVTPTEEELLAFTISSAQGNEREAMQRVADAVAGLGFSLASIERLKTAVAETTMNAMEHGNNFNPLIQVKIRVLVTADEVIVRVTDRGGGKPVASPATPDLDAKLEGLQSPRGWGLFLIQNMVDRVTIISDEVHHTVELGMKRKH